MKVSEILIPNLYRLDLKLDMIDEARWSRDGSKGARWAPQYKQEGGVIYFLCCDGEVLKAGETGRTMKSVYDQYHTNWESRNQTSNTRAVISLIILDLLYGGKEVYFLFYNCNGRSHTDIHGVTQTFDMDVNSKVHECLTISEILRHDGCIPPLNFGEGASKESYQKEFDLYDTKKWGVVKDQQQKRLEMGLPAFMDNHPDRFTYDRYLGVHHQSVSELI